MLKSLAASLGFAYAAHSAALSAAMLPVLAVTVAAEAAYVIRSLRKARA